MVKKWISEFVGTMLLVIFGCGTAVAFNTYVSAVAGIALPWSLIVIACAFGLVLTALVYTIGKVSGAHVNPAVSIACLIDGRMSVVECIEYVILQVLGGIAGAAVLLLIFGSGSSLGANGYDTLSALQTVAPTIQVTAGMAFGIEVILTFVFVLVVLATTKKENCNAGIVIGLTLTLVHIMGIPFTGTSVNPARSIGPALLTGGDAVSQLWVFILAPLVGGILAALFYKFVISDETPTPHYSRATVEDDDDEVEVEEVEDENESEDDEVEEVKKPRAKKSTTKTTKSTKTTKTTKKSK